MNLTDADLDSLLSAVDTFPEHMAAAPAVALALDQLLEPLVAKPKKAPDGRRNRHRRRRFATAFAASGLIAMGGVAAAVTVDQWVSTDAPNFAVTARAAAAGLPLPPGDDIDEYIALAAHGPAGVFDDLRVHFSYDAACAWQGYWLQEHGSGNSAAADHALQVLQQIPDWPQWAGNTGDDVIAGYRTEAAAAAAGNPTPVRKSWTANCTDLPRAWATK